MDTSILDMLKKGAGISDTTVYDEQLNVLIVSTKARLTTEGISEVQPDDVLFPMYVDIIRFIVVPLVKENYKYSAEYTNNLFAIKNEIKVAQLANRSNITV